MAEDLSRRVLYRDVDRGRLVDVVALPALPQPLASELPV